MYHGGFGSENKVTTGYGWGKVRIFPKQFITFSIQVVHKYNRMQFNSYSAWKFFHINELLNQNSHLTHSHHVLYS